MSEETVTTHDFGDGRGPVPAHRHRNPDGTLGGWVADTATVAPTARIGPNAQVYGWARVFGGAQISGSARIYGTAQISGTARVSGLALVHDSRHWLQVGPIGSESRHVTIHREKNSTARIVAGCWAGTPDELEARIENAWTDADESDRARWQADYRMVVAAARARQAEWAAA